MYINENLSALNAWRNLVNTQSDLSMVIQQLSSGLRINSPADDPSGYAISQQMQTQINGYDQAQQNAQNGISLIQTANGALNQAMAILQNMRQLAVEASSGTTTPTDRVDIQNQVDQLAAELTQLSQTTQFNGMNLLDGSFATTPITLQVGANGTTADQLSFTLGAVDARTLGVARGTYVSAVSVTGLTGVSGISVDGTNGDLSMDLNPANTYQIVVGTYSTSSGGVGTYIGLYDYSTSAFVGSTVAVTTNGTVTIGNENAAQAILVDVSNVSALTVSAVTITLTTSSSNQLGLSVVTTTDAQNAINQISAAIQTISNEQANIGAVQDRLNYTIALLGAASDNITAAQSRITGVDMAKEMALFTRDQILLQSGTQMLFQANQIPTAVLTLLR